MMAGEPMAYRTSTPYQEMTPGPGSGAEAAVHPPHHHHNRKDSSEVGGLPSRCRTPERRRRGPASGQLGSAGCRARRAYAQGASSLSGSPTKRTFWEAAAGVGALLGGGRPRAARSPERASPTTWALRAVVGGEARCPARHGARGEADAMGPSAWHESLAKAEPRAPEVRSGAPDDRRSGLRAATPPLPVDLCGRNSRSVATPRRRHNPRHLGDIDTTGQKQRRIGNRGGPRNMRNV